MASDSTVKQSLCTFTSKLYQIYVESQKGSLVNTFMSPLSIYSVVAMALNGSDGNTKTEMLAALQLPTQFASSGAHQIIGSTLSNYFKSSQGVKLNMANAMFVRSDENIRDQFKTSLTTHYQAHSENMPFGSDPNGCRQRINQWVAAQTKDKIKELMGAGSVSSDTNMVLANALYFRGLWSKKFRKESTKDGEFHKLDGSTMSVKLMFAREEMEYATLSNMNCTVVRLPFMESNWEMVIVLPTARDGLNQLMKQMSEPNTLSTILSTPCDKEEIKLYLPRFKLEEAESMDMVGPLKMMGMNDLFTSGKADLSGISGSKNLYVSTVQHKAVLEVDEEGATAAAATGMGIMLMCAVSYPEIRIDHPFFVALVCDKTIPVFLGHVTEPQSL